MAEISLRSALGRLTVDFLFQCCTKINGRFGQRAAIACDDPDTCRGRRRGIAKGCHLDIVAFKRGARPEHLEQSASA